jgi:hypothetical protein
VEEHQIESSCEVSQQLPEKSENIFQGSQHPSRDLKQVPSK